MLYLSNVSRDQLGNIISFNEAVSAVFISRLYRYRGHVPVYPCRGSISHIFDVITSVRYNSVASHVLVGKKTFYLTKRSTHFVYGYRASDI